MPVNRNYSSTAVRTTLTSDVTATGTTISVASTSGWPGSVPFTLMLDAGTASEELVTVTNVSGTNLSITRGVDGTSGVAHSTGADVRHAWSARDLREPQEHIAASAGVHGVSGDVVGTTSTQTLTGKTMSGLNNSFSNIPKAAIPSDTVYTTGAQTLTGKTLDGGSNTLTNIPKTALPGDTTYTTATQTFSNKTISGSANTLTNIADGSITGLSASKLSGTVAKANLPADTLYGSGLTITTSFLTVEPGWAIEPESTASQFGNVYVLEIVCSRTGGAFSFSSAGNVTDEKICTITSSTWRPPRTMYPHWVGFDTSGGASVLSTGSVFILDGHPTSDIATGDKVRVTLTFIK